MGRDVKRLGRRRGGVLLVMVVVGLVVVAGPVSAALDPTFDGDGKLVPDVYGEVLDVMTDGGKIVAVGYEGWVGDQFAAFRFSGAGVPDASFGGPTDGVSLTGIGGRAVGVAPRGGGGYWLGGWTGPTSAKDFALVALDSSGQVDATFGGGDGIETIDIGGDDVAYGMNVDPGGNILLTGPTIDVDGGMDLAVARFTSAGAPDIGFGTGGGAVLDAGAQWDLPKEVDTTSAGLPVIVGSSGADDGSSQMVIARFEADGDPDLTFGGGDALLLAGVGNRSAAESLEITANDRIVVGATTWRSGAADDRDTFNFVITRVTTGGTIDTAFGAANGRTITDFGGEDHVSDLAIMSDGSYLLVGPVEGALSDLGMARYTRTGVLDPIFGKQRVHIFTDQFGNSSDDAPSTVELMTDGRFILGGETNAKLFSSTGYRVFLTRHKAPGRACTEVGTAKANTMTGTAGPDVFCALGGADLVKGAGGNDLLLGGDGNDRLYGGDGADALKGETGDDLLDGGIGADTCSGGPGRDRHISC